MRFQIRFRSHYSCRRLQDIYNVKGGSYGLDALNQIRRKYPDKNIVDIIPPMSTRNDELILDCSEEMAKSIHHFKDKKEIIITVFPNYFNRYMYLRGELNASPFHGPGDFVYHMKYVLDKDQILKDWIENECPLKWGYPYILYSIKKFFIDRWFKKNAGKI